MNHFKFLLFMWFYDLQKMVECLVFETSVKDRVRSFLTYLLIYKMLCRAVPAGKCLIVRGKTRF